MNGSSSSRVSTAWRSCSVAGHDPAASRGGNWCQQFTHLRTDLPVRWRHRIRKGRHRGGGQRSRHDGSRPNSTSRESRRYMLGASTIPSSCTLCPWALFTDRRPAVVGQDVGDHVDGHRRQVQLRRGQVGMPEHPLDIGQRQQWITGHPVGRGVPQIVQRPVRAECIGCASEHGSSGVIGQGSERAPSGPPQRFIREVETDSSSADW